MSRHQKVQNMHGIPKSESESQSVVSDSLWPHGQYSPWSSPGQNTGVSSLSLLQGIFPTQGSNPDLPHCSRILYQLSHKGSPRILEWVAYHFSRGSSWPRNRTAIRIAGRFFINWAMRESGCDWCVYGCVRAICVYECVLACLLVCGYVWECVIVSV